MDDSPATANHRIDDWLGVLASDSPTPGGGAVAAVNGAVGASLIAMTARLTVGREAFSDLEPRMQELVARADAARARFLELADEDAHAFDGVMQAFTMPKDTDDERASRSDAIQRGYLDAASVPLEIARTAIDLLPLAEDATALGNPQASSDGYSGAIALYAAVRCALANVQINASSLRDEAKSDELLETSYELRRRADALLEESETAFKLRTLPDRR
jgi:formiminotetrahydrofolate cyclodeaminase